MIEFDLKYHVKDYSNVFTVTCQFHRMGLFSHDRFILFDMFIRTIDTKHFAMWRSQLFIWLAMIKQIIQSIILVYHSMIIFRRIFSQKKKTRENNLRSFVFWLIFLYWKDIIDTSYYHYVHTLLFCIIKTILHCYAYAQLVI